MVSYLNANDSPVDLSVDSAAGSPLSGLWELTSATGAGAAAEVSFTMACFALDSVSSKRSSTLGDRSGYAGSIRNDTYGMLRPKRHILGVQISNILASLPLVSRISDANFALSGARHVSPKR